MLRHAVRILRSDLAGWVPSMGVVAVISMLVTACVNQFVWTTSAEFVRAARGAGLDGAEFTVVSVTIYTVVALLGAVSLSVVGSATVERTRSTFAQWRLMGATPRQVRGCLWALVACSSTVGSLPGAVIGSGVSAFLVPWFNAMAAASFAGGVGEFSPPPFAPSPAAGILAVGVSVVTCLVGAAMPARRAALVEPVEVVRGAPSIARRRPWARWVTGGLLLVTAIAMAAAAPATLDPDQIGLSAMVMVNAATWVGGLAATAMIALGPTLVHLILTAAHRVMRSARMPVAQVAVRAARAQAAVNANAVTPLAAAIALYGVIFTATGSYLSVMAAAGFPLENPNVTDITLLSGLFCVMATATSVAVIALSGRHRTREHGTLRAAGMSPSEVSRLIAWQTLSLALCATVLGVVPVALVACLVAGCSVVLVGSVALSVPWMGLATGVLVCWFVLWAVQFSQAAPSLRRDIAATLRHA